MTSATNGTTWTADGMCAAHGLTPGGDGRCGCCALGLPAAKAAPLTGIAASWARSTTSRMRPGGDLAPRDWSRLPKWARDQMAR